ncbi:PREDICTED: uncharacterized protein LOC106106229 isoform X2 [Papilio polytes]|uniref:uncharacterized protein LOC106106229 isoform X2 n=1 Tax=Papilio polytes TaxID=76194 RepID=UPI000675F067|nr:PREDICTED: uncharacterized protein LOC106106229 isoform X2 [Papilio polytes]
MMIESFGNPFLAIDSLPRFTGDDVTYTATRWAQDIEDNAQIFAWNPQQKLIIARRCLSGTAELWAKTEKTFGTYEELKAALLKEFPESVNCKEMHEMMSGRKKRPNETYYQYMLIMKELGKRAKFPDYVSIQYIIDGIDDYEANKILLYGVTTYPVLKEKLNLYETFKQKQKQEFEMRQHSVRPRAVECDFRKTLRCYKCGEAGHLSNSCTQGVKCFKCNSFGHIGKDCQMAAMKTQAHGAGASGSGNDRKCHPDRSMFVHGGCDNDSNQRHECQQVLNVNNNSPMANKSVKQESWEEGRHRLLYQIGKGEKHI